MDLPIVTDLQPADREVCLGNVVGDEADDEPDECHGDQQPSLGGRNGDAGDGGDATPPNSSSRGDWI